MSISLEQCLVLLADVESEENRLRGVKSLSALVDKNRLVEILQPIIRDDVSLPVVSSAICLLGNSFRGAGDSELSGYFAALVSNDDLKPELRRFAYFAFLKILDVRPTKGFRSIEEMREACERVMLQVKTTDNFVPETDVNWALVSKYLPN